MISFWSALDVCCVVETSHLEQGCGLASVMSTHGLQCQNDRVYYIDEDPE